MQHRILLSRRQVSCGFAPVFAFSAIGSQLLFRFALGCVLHSLVRFSASCGSWEVHVAGSYVSCVVLQGSVVFFFMRVSLMWDALLSVDACVGCVRSGRPPFSFPLSLGSVCSPLSLLFLVSFSLLLFAVGNGLHPLVRFAIFFSSPSCPVCIRSSGSVLAASCTFSSSACRRVVL